MNASWIFSILVTLSLAPWAQARTMGVGSDIQEKSPLLANERPAEFKDIGITEKLGAQLDLSLPLINEKGETVTLGSFYNGHKPVSISLVYYSCPGLCNFHFNGVVDALKAMDWSAGDQFQVLAISFDARENSDLGTKKKASYMKVYSRPGTENGFHFLTASPETIQKLTEAVGFKYKWNEEAKEWAHASAAVVTTPDGKISRYLHGIQFDAKTFKLAFSEASEGKIGNFVDKMIWYCFKYDPQQSKYVLYAFRAVQFGAIAIVLLLAAILLPVWIKGRKFR